MFTSHTAFGDPSTPKGAPLRELIKLRLLVFYNRGSVDNIGSSIVRLLLK